MITYAEARYVVTEVARIGFYRDCIARYQKEIDTLEEEKKWLSMPSSPNGKEYIGEAKGNEVKDFTKQLINIIDKQDAIRQEQYEFRQMLRKAEAYYTDLLDSEDAEYVEAYFATRDKRTLQIKYHIGNAYDRIIRIARATIGRI